MCKKDYALATENNIVGCVEAFTYIKTNCDVMSI